MGPWGCSLAFAWISRSSCTVIRASLGSWSPRLGSRPPRCFFTHEPRRMSVALPSSAPRASQSASGSVYLVPSFSNSAGGSWRTRFTSARMAACVSVGVPGGNSIGGAFDPGGSGRAGGCPASECRVSRAGAGRGAAKQRRGAHLEARGADSLLVLRHSQRPDGDAQITETIDTQ